MRAREYGADSASVWRIVSERLPPGRSISRTSIITFLNRMVERGVLSNQEVTGKGGHRKIYHTKLDEGGFIMQTLETLLQNLMEDFPEETRAAFHSSDSA